MSEVKEVWEFSAYANNPNYLHYSNNLCGEAAAIPRIGGNQVNKRDYSLVSTLGATQSVRNHSNYSTY